MPTFGERLSELRKSKGFSQKALAQEMHVSQSTISCYELDKKSPPPATLARLAGFFSVSVDYLLGSSDVPTPETEFCVRLQRLTPEGRKKVLHELEWVEQWEQKWKGMLAARPVSPYQ